MTSPLCVLDTNVVLDLLHFRDPSVRTLYATLEAGRLRCAASAQTFGEWERVLAYPGFGLTRPRQAELGARYRAFCAFPAARPAPGVPRCADADDQKFLDLAAALAAPLVTRDKAVLRLRRRCAPRFAVLTPAEAAGWLETI